MAVMLSEEQFTALMARLTMTGGGGPRRKRLDTKYIKLSDFDGEPVNWGDWSFAFKRSIRAVDKEVFDLMEKVERATGEFDESALNEFAESGDVSDVSGQLYDVLCTVMKGDESVDGCEG
jgi:hypothetical protein